MCDERSIRVLEQKHMVSILLFLCGNDGSTKTALYDSVSTNPRMPEKLDALQSAGLVRMEQSPDSKAVRIYLTELGRSVAGMLQDADRRMSV